MTETYNVGITGAGGYIGSRVGCNLLDDDHDITAIDNNYSSQVKEISGVDIIGVDIRNRDELRDIFSDVDIVMHLAAMSGVEDCDENPEMSFDVNVGGTQNVAWICKEKEIPLVFPCSMAVIGDPVEFPITSGHPRNPLNMYGLTKAMSEEDIEWMSRDTYPAHIYLKSNLYGNHILDGNKISKSTVINIFVDLALNKEPITVHKPGTQARDFIHVKDVARAYVKSLDILMDQEDNSTNTFTLASGECESILGIANIVKDIVQEELGYSPEIEMIDNPRVGEAEMDDFRVDTSRARELIDFEVEHCIESTVREMVT